MSLYKEGTYRAKITDYGIAKPRDKKTDLVIVKFLFDGIIFNSTINDVEEKKDCELTWTGYLSIGAFPITEETVVGTLGLDYKGGSMQEKATAWADFAKGMGSGVIGETEEYDIEIKNETYEGKESSKIRYVNKPGQTRSITKLDASDAESFVKSSMMGLFANAGQGPIPNMAPEPSFDAKEEIPF